MKETTSDGIIETVAGNGTSYQFSGDLGPATNASLCSPQGVAVDSKGNLFISDTCNNCVREVGLDGVIRTVVGVGYADSDTDPFSTAVGDGESATNSVLIAPLWIAVDALGRLFITDNGHDRIRMVDTNGIITTYSGGGRTLVPTNGSLATNMYPAGPGLAIDSAGNLVFVSAETLDCVFKVRFFWIYHPSGRHQFR